MLSDPLRLHAMGENATVLAAHDASEKIIIIVPTAELENANDYAIGSEVSFTFSGATAHLFDRETGLNLEA